MIRLLKLNLLIIVFALSFFSVGFLETHLSRAWAANEAADAEGSTEGDFCGDQQCLPNAPNGLLTEKTNPNLSHPSNPPEKEKTGKEQSNQ